uniref:Uncharacterized protein n=1 Tax=Brassica campestris TaxID=3711 RepID=A0A3P5ZKW0_BRACM|nr:unnamed protein product [Brassica rapa]
MVGGVTVTNSLHHNLTFFTLKEPQMVARQLQIVESEGSGRRLMISCSSACGLTRARILWLATNKNQEHFGKELPHTLRQVLGLLAAKRGRLIIASSVGT